MGQGWASLWSRDEAVLSTGRVRVEQWSCKEMRRKSSGVAWKGGGTAREGDEKEGRQNRKKTKEIQ